MHPHIEHLANQAHFDDLRREAEQHRREARQARRRVRRPAPIAAPVLSPAVRDVLVFAEHQPSQSQLAQIVDQLKGLHDDMITALLHYRPTAPPALADEAGSHSLTLPTSSDLIPAQRTPPAVDQQLSHVVGALRAAGHETTGELVAGSMSRALLSHVRERRPEAVILLTNRHRLAHLAHRDLERQLRRQTSVPVITLPEDTRSHVVA